MVTWIHDGYTTMSASDGSSMGTCSVGGWYLEDGRRGGRVTGGGRAEGVATRGVVDGPSAAVE